MSHRTVPAWAFQWVSTAVDPRSGPGHRSINPTEVARRTGLSKSLVRRCLYLLRRQ
jgi:hypothetical protein